MRFQVFDYAQHADGSFAPGHAVTIYESDGTTPAILYTSETGSETTSNPILSDSTGLVTCWVACPQPKKSVDGGPVTDLNVRSRGIAALSVRDKGARGDGTVDDSAALQAAIAASQRVVLPSGTYRLDHGVHIPSGTTIEGNGRSTVIYVSSAFNTADNKVLYNDGWDGAGATGITLRNLSFKVDDAAAIYSGAPFPRGVLAFGLVDGLVLENIYSQNLYCRVFCWLQSCKHVRVRGWDVRNLKDAGGAGGVLWSFAGYDSTHSDSTWDAYDISVRDSTLLAKVDEPVSIWGLYGATYDIDISGNLLENTNTASYAFSLISSYDNTGSSGSVRDVTFCDNILHGGALIRNDCARVSVVGNVVRPYSGENGFEILRYDPVNASPPAPQQIEIAKNIIYNPQRGIWTAGVLQSDVCENKIYGSADNAIAVTEFGGSGDGGPADNSIRANRLVSCAKGIYFSQSGVTVESNRARGTDVFIEGEAARAHGIDDTVVRGNHGYAYTDKGIWIRGHNAAQAGLLIEGNTLEGDGVTSAYGVRVEYGTYTEAAVLRNRVKNNATLDYSVPFDNTVEIAGNYMGSGGIWVPCNEDRPRVGARKHYCATAAPTFGAWEAGDVVWNKSAAAGGYAGWVCTTAGKAHPACTGDTTASSTTIANVNPTTAFANGDAIRGAGIPTGTTVVSGGGTATLVISQAATATATGVSLYDAVFKTFGAISP